MVKTEIINTMPKSTLIEWSNPHEVDLTKPYIYYISVQSKEKEYRYIGKGSRPSRMKAYDRNVSRIFEGKSKRPTIKKNGEPQKKSNIQFRYVHLVLAVAVKEGWDIKHYPIENCEGVEHKQIEDIRVKEYKCNMNDGKSWFVKDFEQLAKDIN